MMLNFTDHAIRDFHQHKDFRSTYLCYLNHVRDCRKQNDAEALSLQFNDKFLAACKEEYKIVTTSKVPEAVRVGAAHLLTGEIDLQLEAAKEELGHNRSSAAAPPHDSSANTLLPLTPTSDAMLSSKARNNHKQQPAVAYLPRYTPSNLSQARQGIYEMDDNVKDKPTQSEGSTDIAHEENQPEVDFTEEEITESIGPTSADSGALDYVNVAAPSDAHPITTLEDLEQEPGSNFAKRKNTAHARSTIADQPKKKKKADEKFADTARSSLQRRHSTLGPKWHLGSGTVVEDVLLQAGLELTVDHPIRSFMIDLQDKYTESLFSPQDWIEIKSNLPHSATYSSEAAAYLDTLADIDEEQDIISVLESWPRDPEKAIVQGCVASWFGLYEMDPSPFALDLSEDWWMKNAWNGTRLLTKAVPGSYIITGEVTGVDSASRRNHKERHVNITPQNNRKRMGVRADMIWRTVNAPVRDWMIGEAAKQWGENAGKYVQESTFKVPRQLHDILSARSQEVGGAHRLRNAWITGMVFGGPVVQRVSLCWGAQGSNVTRFKRWTPARIYPSLEELPLSLKAARQLLLVRAETLRLIEEYNRAKQEEWKQERARASHHNDSEDDWRGEEDWRDLLNSSP